MNLKGYRTVIVNGLLASIGVITFAAHLIVNANIDPRMSLTAIVIALANAYLRSITDTPMGQGAPKVTTLISTPAVTASSAETTVASTEGTQVAPPTVGGTSAGV